MAEDQHMDMIGIELEEEYYCGSCNTKMNILALKDEVS